MAASLAAPDPAVPCIGPCHVPPARSNACCHTPDKAVHWATPRPPRAAGISPRRGTPRPSLRPFGSPTAPHALLPASPNSPVSTLLRISRKNSRFQQYHCLWLIKAPFLLSHPLSVDCRRRATAGGLRNFDIFDFALNGVE